MMIVAWLDMLFGGRNWGLFGVPDGKTGAEQADVRVWGGSRSAKETDEGPTWLTEAQERPAG
jgi:hypothetical protein